MTDSPGVLDRLAQVLIVARSNQGLSGGAVLTFAALLLHAATGDGLARPSVDALAAMTGLHRRNVQKALDALLEVGAIESTEADRTRRSRGGRERVTRFVVAPHAIRGDSAALCRRERVADAPPLDGANSGEIATVDAENSGEIATAEKLNRGAESAKPWRCEHETVALPPPEQGLNSTEQVPPNPPRGAGDRSASQEDNPEDDARLELHQRLQTAIVAVAPARNPFKLRVAVMAFADAGGTECDLERLIELSAGGDRNAATRVGLVMHWIASVGVWRGVLAEHELEGREVSRRRHASSTGQPVPVHEVLRLPARAEGT